MVLKWAKYKYLECVTGSRVVMQASSWLEIGQLYDERYRVDKYWERLEALPVNTPNTLIHSLIEVDGADVSDDDVNAVIEWMEQNEYEQAFIRSGYKAAPIRIHDGSIIQSCERDEVRSTISDLLAQHIHADIPHGRMLVVRELLDFRFCMQKHVMCHPEMRYFIENGEVMYHTPREFVGSDHVCAAQYSYLDELLDKQEPPTDEAQIVANEFTDYSWSVDFAMDTTGTWYVTEIHLNGVRWNEEESDWMNICGHGDVEMLGPREIHGAALRYVTRESSM